MGTLIDAGRPTIQDEKDFVKEPVWLRNPHTGIIFGLTHIDTIKRCQSENYLPSSEEACKAQAPEMYAVQGRPYPPTPPAPATDGDAPDMSATVHERNRRAALRG